MFIFVLGDYIQHYVLVKYMSLPFSDQILHFLCTDLYIIFVLFPNSLFSSALLHPYPSLYLTLCVSFMIPQPFPIPTLYLLLPCFIPCVHASVLEQNVPRTNLPQLTALNHDPWPPHHSTETTLRYGWSVHLCSSSILLSSCLTLLALLSF